MQAAKSFSSHFIPSELAFIFASEIGMNDTVGLDKITGKKFSEILDTETELIATKTINGTYRFTNYRQLLALKGPSDPPREICVSTIRDKVTLKTLGRILDEVYENTCTTPQPQPIIRELLTAIQTGNYDSFIKFDIRHFYASIDHDVLLHILRRKIRKKELLGLIENAITTPSAQMNARVRKRRSKGIPEGLPISNRLANIYVQDIDAALRKEKAIEYRRYVDDIIILCNKGDIKKLQRKMNNATKRLALQLHPDKTQEGFIGKDAFEYLGYAFNKNGVEPRRRSRIHLEKWLESHMRGWRNAQNKHYWTWKLGLRITGCRITEDGSSFDRFGWLFYFSQSTNAALPHQLDALIQKLAQRYEVSLPNDLPTFSKSYYEIHYRKGEGGYIPLIDFTISTADKKETLTSLYGRDFVSDLSDEDVAAVFKRRMLQEAKQLEHDIGVVS